MEVKDQRIDEKSYKKCMEARIRQKKTKTDKDRKYTKRNSIEYI